MLPAGIPLFLFLFFFYALSEEEAAAIILVVLDVVQVAPRSTLISLTPSSMATI